MHFSSLVSLAASVSVAAAQIKGFNTGSTFTDGSAKAQSDFESEFSAAKQLQGASGFTSARLYTCVQGGTTNTPISAIPAAIAQDTKLLLGLWASGGQADYSNELAALKSAISQYGTAFTSRVLGISVGSEDLYRTSTTGIAAMAGVGTTPDVIVSYINQLKSALSGTALSSAKITHVDTYNAWTNGSNSAVISAVDFISMDVYPYFQSTMANSIEQGSALFNTAYDETIAAAQGKDVWVTETGWPVSGPNQGQAVASVANAKTYWDQVGCNTLFGKVNTFWYILQDALPTTPSPSFGLIGAGSNTAAPLFNLTCPAVSATTASAVSSATATTAAAAASSSAAGGAAIIAAGSNNAASAISSGSPASSATATTMSSVRAGFSAAPSSSKVASAAASGHTSSSAAARSSSSTPAATTSRSSTSSTGAAAPAATTSSSNVSKSAGTINSLSIGAVVLGFAAYLATTL